MIFICYRRQDSQDIAGRIYDRLVAAFGEKRVTIDVDDIPPGLDFREHLMELVGKARVFLALIRPNWRRDEPARATGSQAPDFVRTEIEAALRLGLLVVPVLVGGAAMPSPDSLPPELRALAWRQAVSIESGRNFHRDVGALIRALEQAVLSAAEEKALRIPLGELVLARAPLPQAMVLDIVQPLLRELSGRHARGECVGPLDPSEIHVEWRVPGSSANVHLADPAPPPTWWGPAEDMNALGRVLSDLCFGPGLSSSDGELRVSKWLVSMIGGWLATDRDGMNAEIALLLIREEAARVTPPSVPAPLNLDFSRRDQRGVPVGWFDSVGYVNRVSNAYSMGSVSTPDGRCWARLGRVRARPQEFGSMMQRSPAECLAGHRLRLKGVITSTQVEGWGGFWARVDGQEESLFFDNMSDRPVRGTTEPQAFEIEVPAFAEPRWLNYGLVLSGDGEIQVAGLDICYQASSGAWRSLDSWSIEPQSAK